MTKSPLVYRVARLLRRDDGATSIEYSLVLLTIVLVLVFALATGVDGMLAGAVNEISGSIP
jgi:Flp pilus assembly pilin Flp